MTDVEDAIAKGGNVNASSQECPTTTSLAVLSEENQMEESLTIIDIDFVHVFQILQEQS